MYLAGSYTTVTGSEETCWVAPPTLLPALSPIGWRRDLGLIVGFYPVFNQIHSDSPLSPPLRGHIRIIAGRLKYAELILITPTGIKLDHQLPPTTQSYVIPVSLNQNDSLYKASKTSQIYRTTTISQ